MIMIILDCGRGKQTLQSFEFFCTLLVGRHCRLHIYIWFFTFSFSPMIILGRLATRVLPGLYRKMYGNVPLFMDGSVIIGYYEGINLLAIGAAQVEFISYFFLFCRIARTSDCNDNKSNDGNKMASAPSHILGKENNDDHVSHCRFNS